MSNHDDCYLCDVCGRHTPPADQWPCLFDGTPLCATCECPTIHHNEACS